MSSENSAVNLSDGEVVDFPLSDYLFIEKIGPFMNTAREAWMELHQLLDNQQISKDKIKHMSGLSFIDETKEGDDKYTYRAGLILNSTELTFPEQLKLGQIAPGKFLKFTLTGGYHQLPEAYPLAFTKLNENNHQQRNDQFAMEIYLNTPAGDTPEEDLKTEIYLPIV